jgi:hypothetical protein
MVCTALKLIRRPAPPLIEFRLYFRLISARFAREIFLAAAAQLRCIFRCRWRDRTFEIAAQEKRNRSARRDMRRCGSSVLRCLKESAGAMRLNCGCGRKKRRPEHLAAADAAAQDNTAAD